MSEQLALAAVALNVTPQHLSAAGMVLEPEAVAGSSWLVLRSRRQSPVFALATATVPAGNGAIEGLFACMPTLGLAAVMSRDSTPAQLYRRNFYTGSIETISQGIAQSRRRPSTSATSAMQAVDQRFEALLFAAHSTLRDIDGLHPDEALDELCKLLELKLLDEKFPPAEQVYGTARGELPAEVVAADLRALALSASSSSTPLAPKASAPALAEIAHALSKWSLRNVNADIRGRAFQKILGTTFRADLGQYFTPTPIVEILVEAIAPRPEERVLDPFCGSGHFLAKTVQHIRACTRQTKKASSGKVQGVEINERMVRVARVDSELESDRGFDVFLGNSLLPFNNIRGVEPAAWDVVVTNPPFGSAVNAEASARLGPFELARGNSTPLEILGLERSVEFLKPGGRIAIVLPEGILTNQRLQHVRDWLHEHLDIAAIIEFPRHAFAPLGANIATCAIVAYRKGSPRQSVPKRTLMLAIENLGYDASGRAVAGSEAEAAATLVQQFLAER